MTDTGPLPHLEESNESVPTTVILIIGLPGSGKTTIANGCAASLGWPMVSSEHVRAILFEKGTQVQDKDFSVIELKAAYNCIHLLLDFLLRSRQSAIVEGVFRSQAQRRIIEDTVHCYGAKLIRIWLTAEENKSKARLQVRQARGSVSPGGPVTYDRLKDKFDHPSDDYVKIDTSNNGPTQVLSLVVELAKSHA